MKSHNAPSSSCVRSLYRCCTFSALLLSAEQQQKREQTKNINNKRAICIHSPSPFVVAAAAIVVVVVRWQPCRPECYANCSLLFAHLHLLSRSVLFSLSLFCTLSVSVVKYSARVCVSVFSQPEFFAVAFAARILTYTHATAAASTAAERAGRHDHRESQRGSERTRSAARLRYHCIRFVHISYMRRFSSVSSIRLCVSCVQTRFPRALGLVAFPIQKKKRN